MKNQPTLTKHLTGLCQPELEQFQAIVEQAEAYLNSFAAPLQVVARPFFNQMVQGEFSQVAALLPHWLSDLLPVPVEIGHRLGVAQLFLWWYYYLQDELIDHNAAPAALLSGHLALLKSVDLYESLGLTRAPCWAEFQRLTLTCAEATALELATRFTTPEELTPDHLAPFTIDFLMNRVAPFTFTTLAQLHLASIPLDDARHHDLPAALRCFAAARQLGDDASDWLADLQAGQLNYVSAHLMGRLYRRGLATGGHDLDRDRLAGYHISDNDFWIEIEQTVCNLNQQALDHLAPYGDCRLRALIQHQLNQHAKQFAAARSYRANRREIFGLETREP